MTFICSLPKIKLRDCIQLEDFLANIEINYLIFLKAKKIWYFDNIEISCVSNLLNSIDLSPTFGPSLMLGVRSKETSITYIILTP
jgi:hypothetical protein